MEVLFINVCLQEASVDPAEALEGVAAPPEPPLLLRGSAVLAAPRSLTL